MHTSSALAATSMSATCRADSGKLWHWDWGNIQATFTCLHMCGNTQCQIRCHVRQVQEDNLRKQGVCQKAQSGTQTSMGEATLANSALSSSMLTADWSCSAGSEGSLRMRCFSALCELQAGIVYGDLCWVKQSPRPNEQTNASHTRTFKSISDALTPSSVHSHIRAEVQAWSKLWHNVHASSIMHVWGLYIQAAHESDCMQ